MIRDRFAPSPTGLLHLGHAYSALTAYDHARASGGQFLLRIEDIDTQRCKDEFVDAIFQDLEWLGIDWDGPVLHQSNRMGHYNSAVTKLTEMGLTYACHCTRGDIKAALSAPQEGTTAFDGPVYPGLCRDKKLPAKGAAIRLNIQRAIEYIGDVSALGWFDSGYQTLDENYLLNSSGDIVLARKDIGTSYHIAVVVDDAAQEITHVTRGEDMRSATPIHRLLQALLGFPTPKYHHHKLIRDENGKRLAKRHDSKSIAKFRKEGWSPQSLRELLNQSDPIVF